MIGVCADTSDLPFVEEFFELFKTPWEPAALDKHYPVVLVSTEAVADFQTERLVVYGSRESAVDRVIGVTAAQSETTEHPVTVEWQQLRFPLYGHVATFDPGADEHGLKCSGRAVNYRRELGSRQVFRFGYDLFQEIRHLLTEGQPALHAGIPTLDLHIALLRQTLVESGMPLVEIPPRPCGCDFTACLTHDIDFHGMTRHRLDKTLAGFVVRATAGTLVDLARRRRSVVDAARNWLAALKLPFVFLKLAKDPWRPFDDYGRIEDGRRSTFFVVPFKHRPGIGPNGAVDTRRGVAYQASEVGDEVRRAAARGSEIAVHGIDAWHDANAGRAELQQIIALTGGASAGIRMHWLYFAADSARRLEAAGFAYDSSWGYNEAVGYRAGTSQVFRLHDTRQLLELPLSIMDSALFFSGRMNLHPDDAWQRCVDLVANARKFGGTLVINWHDRSLAPERLWGGFYLRLLGAVSSGNRAWFARASETVSWFGWRRSVRFSADISRQSVTIQAAAPRPCGPAALVQVHRPGRAGAADELEFEGDTALSVRL